MKLMNFEMVFQTETENGICVTELESFEDVWFPKATCEIRPAHPSRGDIITLTTDEATAIWKGFV